MGQQIVTLLAVVLGGAIAALSGWWMERARAQREARLRWHEERQRLYAAYLAHMQPCLRWLLDVFTAIDRGHGLPPRMNTRQWEEDMEPLLAQLNLVASDDVLTNAQVMVDLSMTMTNVVTVHYLRSSSESHAVELHPLRDARRNLHRVVEETMPKLVNVMRRDLGEPSVRGVFNPFLSLDEAS